jgi:hypothetical protein
MKEPIPRKDLGAQITGDAAAALKNREIRVRLQIIDALQRLGTPMSEWPDFVQTFYRNPQERTAYSDSFESLPFYPPIFDRLSQSPAEWVKVANTAWEQHRDRFLKQCQFGVIAGVDEEIPVAKSTRGPGRKGRRRNAALGLRFEWAARRLSGAAWKEIPTESFNEDQVKKTASEVLKLAGWGTKIKKSGLPTKKTRR